MQSVVKSVAVAMTLALAPLAAQAGQVLQYFEQTVGFAFEDLGVRGRSVGDMMYYDTIMINQTTGQVEGTKTGMCTTYMKLPNGDYIGDCYETVTFNDGSTMVIHGSNFNQVAFERFVPQSLMIVAGTGRFANKMGSENIVQVRFPDQAFVTLSIFN